MAVDDIERAVSQALGNGIEAQILQHVPAIIVAYDLRTGEYIYVNDGVKTLLGYPRSRILKDGLKFMSSIVHPDDLPRITKENEQAVQAVANKKRSPNTPVAFEYRLKHRDGSWRWVHSDGVVFKRDKTGAVTHVMNITVDITDRKAAEAESRLQLERTARERQISEEKLHLALTSSKLGTWEWNIETGDLIWSEQMKRLSGLAPSAELTYESALTFHHPADQPTVRKVLSSAIKTGRSYQMEYRVIWPDNSEHWLLTHGKVVKRGDKVVGMIGISINIDERKKYELDLAEAKTRAELAKQELEISEHRYRAFIINSSEGIWRAEIEKPLPIKLPISAQLKHMYRYAYMAEANDAMAAMYGFQSARPIIGARLGDLLVESDPNNHAYLTAFIKSGYKLSGVESHEVDKNGNDKYFRNSLVGVIENGHVVRAWGSQSDITEMRNATTELIRNEERLDLALMASKTGMWEWDISSNVLTWSDQLKKIYGLPLNTEMTYEKYAKLIHPKDRTRMQAIVEKARKSGRPYSVEHRIVLADGSVHWVLGQGKALMNHGKAVRMVGTSMNIDERKAADMQLRASEAKFRQLFDSAPDAIFLVDSNMQISDANTAACKLLGYSERQLLKLGLRDLLDFEGLKQFVQLQSTNHENRFLFTESQLERRNGNFVSAEISATKLPDSNWLAFVRDSTEQKAHAEAIQKARIKEQVLQQRADLLREQHTQLLILNKAKDEFLSVASHHLRTPASAVKMYLGLIKEGYAGEIAKEQSLYIDQAYDSNEQQLQVIEDILNVAEMDAQRVKLRLKREDIVKLTRNTIEALAYKFNDRKQELTFSTSVRKAVLSIDPVKMSLVLENMIGNASKYTPSGKEISVRIKANKDAIIIQISDQGIGIRKEDMSKIFEKFARVRNEAYITESGTGLGLYWAKHIIEMHEGSIEVTSVFKKGSTFTVRLPRK